MTTDETPTDEWRDMANCRGVDTTVFVFPGVHGVHGQQKILHAKAICADCPVTDECLEAGLAGNEFGIWGGLTEDERRSLKRRRRRYGVALLVGEEVPAAKLTAEQVAEIRESPESQRVIAARLGVCHSTIGLIRRGVNWSSVA